jgi:hypothetical protein
MNVENRPAAGRIFTTMKINTRSGVSEARPECHAARCGRSTEFKYREIGSPGDHRGAAEGVAAHTVRP